MINSIKYFEEKSSSRFEELENDFMKDFTKLDKVLFNFTQEKG